MYCRHVKTRKGRPLLTFGSTNMSYQDLTKVVSSYELGTKPIFLDSDGYQRGHQLLPMVSKYFRNLQ